LSDSEGEEDRMSDSSLLRGTWETKTGGRVGSETGLKVGLWERLRVLWAKVGETGEDVGVFLRTKVEIGMFADDSESLMCLCLDSGPSFKAEGLWRGEVEPFCKGALATKKRSEIAGTYQVGDLRVCSIIRKRGSGPPVGMGLESEFLR